MWCATGGIALVFFVARPAHEIDLRRGLSAWLGWRAPAGFERPTARLDIHIFALNHGCARSCCRSAFSCRRRPRKLASTAARMVSGYSATQARLDHPSVFQETDAGEIFVLPSDLAWKVAAAIDR
jgi:hypothetical protein